MTKILLDAIEVGMELNSDVVDRQGRVLLKAGVTLTEKHLRVFQTWGVLEADIKGDFEQAEDDKVYPPELIDEATKLADIHFQYNDTSHPAMKILYKYWHHNYMATKVH